MRYVVYGCGTPIEVETYSPEVAEAIVIERYGVKIERIIAVREEDEMLSGECYSGGIETSGRDTDSE